MFEGLWNGLLEFLAIGPLWFFILLALVVAPVDWVRRRIHEWHADPIDPEDLEAIHRARTGGSWIATRPDSALRHRFMTAIRLYRLTGFGGQGQETAAPPDAGTREIRNEIRES